MIRKFITKNSLYITSLISICLLGFLIIEWTNLMVMHRLVCLTYIAIGLHEWEEKLFGFEDLNAQHLGVTTEEINNSVGYIALFFLTIYIGIVPLFFPNAIWLTATAMILGLIEMMAHVSAIRMSNSKKKYSAGLVTAFTLFPIISVYGFYYLISNDMMSPIEWLYAFLNLFIPLITAQFISVKSMGVSYKKFLSNAFNSMKSKN